MTRRLLLSTVVTGTVLLVAGAWTVTRGGTVAAPHFPQHALPQASALAPAPGVPIPGLDITPTGVAALWLDGDTRPDLLAWTDNGELRSLRNVRGDRQQAVPLEPGTLSLSLDGRVLDLLVADLDGDGSHDLAALVRPAPDLSTSTVRGTVVEVRPPSITVRETFIPSELKGQMLTPDASRPEVTLPITGNTTNTIFLDASSLETLKRLRPGTTYQLTRLNLAGGPPRVELQFGSPSGAFTPSPCPLPALRADGAEQPVLLGAQDVDRDGVTDLVVRRARVIEGRATVVRAVDVLAQPTGGSTGGLLSATRTYVLRDDTARFPTLPAGTLLVADTREGRAFPIIDSDATTITFRVTGGTIGQPGSQYRITLQPDRAASLRGIGGRCFAADAEVARPVYAVRASGGTGAQATILSDPDGHFPSGAALRGQKVRLGPAPLGPDARLVTIASSTATELTLDAAAGDLTPSIHGVVEGGTPTTYAIVPPTMPDPDVAALLPNERSALTLPTDWAAYTPPARSGPVAAAVLDVNGDGQDDVVVAGGQLLLRLHR